MKKQVMAARPTAAKKNTTGIKALIMAGSVAITLGGWGALAAQQVQGAQVNASSTQLSAPVTSQGTQAVSRAAPSTISSTRSAQVPLARTRSSRWSPPMLRFEFRAMGCHMLALLDSDGEDARAALLQVPDWFAEWEASLSRFRTDSELNGLNRAGARPTVVSDTLWQVVLAAKRAAQSSGGLVTPTLLDALQAAGYDRTFEEIGSGSPSHLESAIVPTPAWSDIEFDPNRRTICLPAGVHLDLGGVAKGWAAEQAMQRLSVHAPVLVDAGGDIALSGARADGELWPIAIADPFDDNTDLEVVSVTHGGVATSGRDYRRWKHKGHWQHHILDPRTGVPAETDVLAATIIASSTVQAEVAAKVALILGSREGLEWIEERQDLAGLLVLESGRVLHSQQWHAYMPRPLAVEWS